MLFNSPLFVAFFLVFYVLFTAVAHGRTAKLWLITGASLVFYSAWDYRFVPLLVGTGLVDFYLADAIARAPKPARRRTLVIASVTMNLAVLAVFKYARFVADTAAALLNRAGLPVAIPSFSIVLPVGVSFYTFQSISYTVDVYRGTLKARKSFAEFLAALTFFPHLVAGPIVRSATLLPQFEKMTPATWDACRRGFLLIAFGLVKKTVADLLGASADAVFKDPRSLSMLDAWTGALAFSGQVYGDFSGYSDIAIGIALVLGFRLPPNFDRPYLATSPIDFWHRWHISFSTWLRDYLWMPLSVASPRRPLRNLVLTMVLGGLWHGASWTFVVWGLYHGLLLAVTHQVGRRRARGAAPRRRFTMLKVLGTFYLVMVGWVIFRAKTLTGAWSILRAMHRWPTWSAPAYWPTITLALVLAGIVGCHGLDHIAARGERMLTRRYVLLPLCAACLAFAFCIGDAGRVFIYFQF